MNTSSHLISRSLLSYPLLILCFAWAGSSAVCAQSLPDVIDEVTRSVVGVGAAYPPRAPTSGNPTRRLLGSGFVVRLSGRTFVATNAHVIPDQLDENGREALAIFLTGENSSQMRFAKIAALDESHDLALLSYEGADLPTMKLSTQVARPGERVAFTGFPIGAVLGLYPSTQEGIISAVTPIARPVDRDHDLSPLHLRRLRDPFNVYQLDAIAYPGNSGSAVYLQENGAVIGIVNSVYVKETRESLLSAPSGIAYAIPVEHLIRLANSVVYE